MGTPKLAMRHEPAANRFTVRLDDQIAYLSYEERGERVLEYTHVYVPPEYRDRGIASLLTQRALEYARTEGIAVIPSCSFVGYYLSQHPEYESVVRRP